MDPKVIDKDGNVQPFAYAADLYGAVHTPVVPFDGAAFRLVELREQEGPAVQMVHVRDRNGEPMCDVEVCRWWPDAPDEFPEGELGPNHSPVSQWYDNAVHGPTNENGDIGFGVGGGDVVHDGDVTNAIWIASWDAPSDLFESRGVWLGGTNHRHLACVFEYREGTDAPPPDGPELLPDVESVLDAMDVIDEMSEYIRRVLLG